MAEREAARSDAAMLATWRAGIARARLAERAALDARRAARHAALEHNAIQRGTMRADELDVGVGSIVGQGAQSAERRHDAIQRGTVRSGGLDAGVGSVVGQGAQSAERRQAAMPSLPPGACPGGGTVRSGEQAPWRETPLIVGHA
jgi:hypothetical protein